MSEFACANGHLMRSGEYRCKICGGRLHTMDGMTDAELRREEAGPPDDDPEENEDDEEEFSP